MQENALRGHTRLCRADDPSGRHVRITLQVSQIWARASVERSGMARSSTAFPLEPGRDAEVDSLEIEAMTTDMTRDRIEVTFVVRSIYDCNTLAQLVEHARMMLSGPVQPPSPIILPAEEVNK